MANIQHLIFLKQQKIKKQLMKNRTKYLVLFGPKAAELLTNLMVVFDETEQTGYHLSSTINGKKAIIKKTSISTDEYLNQIKQLIEFNEMMFFLEEKFDMDVGFIHWKIVFSREEFFLKDYLDELSEEQYTEWINVMKQYFITPYKTMFHFVQSKKIFQKKRKKNNKLN